MKNTLVNIITVNYNASKELLECLDALLASTIQNYRWFVVDNNSSDTSVEEIISGFKNKNITLQVVSKTDFQKGSAKNFKKFVFIKNDENSGFAKGNNLVLQKLSTQNNEEYIWLLNPDVDFEEALLNDLLFLSENSKKTIIGNSIHFYHNKQKVMYLGGFKVNTWRHAIKAITKEREIVELDAIAGTSLFTSINTFKDIGLLPEDYFLYWEETDFCTNAKRNGYTFKVNLKSNLYDKVGASSKTNFTREYLYILNGLKYYKKYFKNRLPFIYLSILLKLVKEVLSGNTLKRKAIYFGFHDYLKSYTMEEIKNRIKSFS